MITVSTRGRYAMRIMAKLAEQPDHRPITKFEIARSEDITPAYVQQLMMTLRAAGLISSHRGRIGGFSLSRPADTITMAEVLEAVEGELIPLPCRLADGCERAGTCPTKPVWSKAAEMLDELFSGITIAELARNAPSAATTTKSAR
jgi:Rrf2 family cysteine metabolism transcriptional repressor